MHAIKPILIFNKRSSCDEWHTNSFYLIFGSGREKPIERELTKKHQRYGFLSTYIHQPDSPSNKKDLNLSCSKPIGKSLGRSSMFIFKVVSLQRKRDSRSILEHVADQNHVAYQNRVLKVIYQVPSCTFMSVKPEFLSTSEFFEIHMYDPLFHEHKQYMGTSLLPRTRPMTTARHC